jgi:Holliday junction resolvase
VNQDEVVRSLKERGFYFSGVLRTGCDAAAPAREREVVPKKKERVIVSAWRPTRDQRRYMSPEDFQACIDHAMRDEGNNPHG